MFKTISYLLRYFYFNTFFKIFRLKKKFIEEKKLTKQFIMVVNRKELDDISPSKEENERSNRPLLDNSGSPESINLVKPYNNDYEPNMDEEPVKDKYNLVYLVFLLFGIACLLPWNIFINATDVGRLLLFG